MKKFITVFLLLVMSFTLFAGCTSDKYGVNLISGGDFETDESTLSGWKLSTDKEASADGKLYLSKHQDADEALGETYLKLVNESTTGNMSTAYQTVEVKKRATYKLTVYMKNTELSKGVDDTFTGASVVILEGDVVLASTSVVGGWTEYTAYIKPSNTNEITVGLRLGGEDSYVKGVACFDNVSLERVKEAPAGVSVLKIVKPLDSAFALSTRQGIWFTAILAVVSVGLVVGAYFLYRHLLAKEDGKIKPLFRSTAITAILIAAVALLVRLILSLTLFNKGGAEELVTTVKLLISTGLGKAYTSGRFVNYGPLELIQMYVAGKIIGDTTSVAGAATVIRLVAILADTASAVVIYLFAKKYVSDKTAVIYATLYSLLPLFFTLSGGHDITVPVTAFLALVMFVCVAERKYIPLLVASLLAVVWTPYALTLIPFVLAYEIYALVRSKDKKLLTTLAVGWAASLILFFVIALPVNLSSVQDGKVFDIFSRYLTALFKNQLSVDNAFNLYGLFGINGTTANSAAVGLNIAFCIVLLVFTVSLYYKNRNRAEVMLLASLFLIGISVFSLNMSEVAMSIGIILLLAYLAVSNDHRLIWILCGFALLSFANVATVMNMSGELADEVQAIYYAKSSVFYGFGNALSAALTLYFGWVVYDITANSNRVLMPPLVGKKKVKKA